MTTFALVAGHWLGGWAWESVTARLRDAGYDVVPITLTGLGDRAHLLGPDIDLETHTLDIVRALEYADARDVVLVSHSGGGMPASQAAARVTDRLSRVVYVETGPLADGMSQADTLGPDERERRLRPLEERPDDPSSWSMPLPGWDVLGGPEGAAIVGLGEAERAALSGRATPQPVRPTTDPVRGTDTPSVRRLPHTLVTCMFPVAKVEEMLAAGHPYFAGFAGRSWDFVELPTGHWPMFSEPARLAESLAGLVNAPTAPLDIG